jgi:hypothetical protein
MASFLTTTRTRRIGRHAPPTRFAPSQMLAFRLLMIGKKYPIAIRGTLPFSRFLSASRKPAIRMPGWMHRPALEKLLELADKDEAAGIADAPWPPHFRKMDGEAARVKMPLITVANSRDKAAALAGLERWKAKHAGIASLLAVDDVLIDSMRGRSSTWTRIRINLRHVPEKQRPPQETPELDDDPTREWRERWKKKKATE